MGWVLFYWVLLAIFLIFSPESEGWWVLFSTCYPCLTMQNEHNSRHFYRRVTGPHKFRTSGTPLTERGAFSVKAKYVKPNDLKFLLKVECSDTKEQPFRRMEITSLFLVSEVPVYVVVLVSGGAFPEVFAVGFDQ